MAPNPAGTGPTRLEANVTDVDGRYFLSLPPGQWEITVTAHQHRPVTLPVTVPEGEPLLHDVVLKPTGG